MTEAEWLASTDPHPMLEFLRGKASDRKLRLFAVACCRRVEFLLDAPFPATRPVPSQAERFADGQAGGRALASARAHAAKVTSGRSVASDEGAWGLSPEEWSLRYAQEFVCDASGTAAAPDPFEAARGAASAAAGAAGGSGIGGI